MFGKILKSEGFDSFKPFKNGELSGGQHELKLNPTDTEGQISIVSSEKYSFSKSDILTKLNLVGFDESILEYKCLEGDFKATSFCFLNQANDIYNPAILLDLKFISRIPAKGELEKIRLDSSELYAYEKYYHRTRLAFLRDLSIENTTILIDGPLFSGINTEYNFEMTKSNASNDFIFFVKNSASEQIINFLNKKNYNNDLHWAYQNLEVFERSQIFSYTSENRSKLFCYLKVANNYSPIRIETDANQHSSFMDSNFWANIISNIIAQMPSNNIQPRIIAVAEKYAREGLKTSNIYNHLVKSGFIATMNEQRF